MLYIRARDGQTVPRDEACAADGQLRSGYSIRVAAVADGRITPRDASVSLSDAETTLAVALARRSHSQRHAYLGDRAPAFTDAQAALAIEAAAAIKRASTMTDSAIGIRHAETVAGRAVHDAALANRKMEIRNAWKRS